MASAIRSFMLPVGFSSSSFSRMRAPFPGTMLRKGNKEVLPMQCRMSRGNSFMTPVPFLMWPDETGHDFQAFIDGDVVRAQISSMTTRIVGAPPELIDAACAKASRPPLEVAHAFNVSIVGKLTSEMR